MPPAIQLVKQWNVIPWEDVSPIPGDARKGVYQLFKGVSLWGNRLFITSVVRLKKITCVLICVN